MTAAPSPSPSQAPRLAIATEVAQPDAKLLRACLDSVERQTEPAWEHLLVVTRPLTRRVRRWIEHRAAGDDRLVVVDLVSAETPSASADDAALEVATAPLFMLLGQHDRLEPDAVAELSSACSSGDTIAYGDHTVVDGEFGVDQVYLKPDFSPELLRNTSYIHRPLVAPTMLLRAVGGFRSGRVGAGDHDVSLRLTEAAHGVIHVPRVLYRTGEAADSALSAQRETADAGRVAVAEHCARIGISATVEGTDHVGCYRLRRVAEVTPLVSVVIPTRGSSGDVWGVSRTFVTSAVESIVERSSYDELEFVIVADEATPPSAIESVRRAAGGRPVQIVSFAGDFNFSAKTNLGAATATGEYLLLLNDDTELIDPDSIEVMVAHLDACDVGMVGAKLLFSDGTLQHGGHVYNGSVGHACTGWPGDSPGPTPLRPLAVERECSGVTAAAALVRRSVFDAVGGFDPELPLNYNDVDFSLKVRAAGQRIIWTPHASWYHFESRTRHSVLLPEETSLLNERWGHEISHDPYCNPNVQRGRHDWFERPPTHWAEHDW